MIQPIPVSIREAWKAHTWLGDTYGLTHQIQYKTQSVLRGHDLYVNFTIPDRDVAMMFKLTWGGK